jgi:hypothetical protein
MGDGRVVGLSSPAVMAPNGFVYRSLSNWASNVAVDCSPACLFLPVLFLAQRGAHQDGTELGRIRRARPRVKKLLFRLLTTSGLITKLAVVRVAERFFSGVLHPHLLGVCCSNHLNFGNPLRG